MTKEQTFEHPPRGHVALLAYDSDNDRFQVVHVDANGLLQVDVAAVADRQANIHSYDGAAWRKQPLAWGYTDRWLEQVAVASATLGWNFLETVAVPPGYVYISSAFAAINQTRNPSEIQLGINVVGSRYYVKRVPLPGANVYVDWTGTGYYKEGDKAVAAIGGCLANDVLTFNVWGYKMKVDM